MLLQRISPTQFQILNLEGGVIVGVAQLFFLANIFVTYSKKPSISTNNALEDAYNLPPVCPCTNLIKNVTCNNRMANYLCQLRCCDQRKMGTRLRWRIGKHVCNS